MLGKEFVTVDASGEPGGWEDDCARLGAREAKGSGDDGREGVGRKGNGSGRLL